MNKVIFRILTKHIILFLYIYIYALYSSCRINQSRRAVINKAVEIALTAFKSIKLKTVKDSS